MVDIMLLVDLGFVYQTDLEVTCSLACDMFIL
jgi:hypothetical protein